MASLFRRLWSSIKLWVYPVKLDIKKEKSYSENIEEDWLIKYPILVSSKKVYNKIEGKWQFHDIWQYASGKKIFAYEDRVKWKEVFIEYVEEEIL